jgi:hypothetical protein
MSEGSCSRETIADGAALKIVHRPMNENGYVGEDT